MRLARAALAAGLGPAWARRAYLDEKHIDLLLAFSLSDNSNCIDVGAHEGRVLRQMVRLAPRGKHIAYEPLPDLAKRLTATFPAVEVRQAALSDVAGASSFVHVLTLPAYSGLRPRSYPGKVKTELITVHTERLDDRLAANYIPSLIKIDVEGAELLVVKGALETIRRYRPIVIFEHGRGGADHYGGSANDMFQLLSKHAGLRIFDLDGNGPYDVSAFADTFARGAYWNFVARP